ncbi:MAG: hypothetical protein FWE48_03930 [Coriobacteriia bacterium]|nr:hypothetical protein [Coriobacteriia bacterium]MCL2746225.1 hypothetical protein [Coriobacteriia bacterium]MCL2870770.1 hypothetical protein [Coriobacteriia bacterium]
MSDSTLITLPFDGTQEHPRPVSAAHRRMLYRDLWSDMIVERFNFTQTGDAEFTVTGVLLVDGAYVRFNRHPISVGGQPMGAHLIVARIGSADGMQNIEFFFAPQGNPEGGLIVATLSPQGASWNATGVLPSPVRIPDGTIVGTKLANQTVTRAQIAANAIDDPRIFTGAVSNRALANLAVTNDKIANGTIAGSKLRRDGWTNWGWAAQSGWTAQAGQHRFARHGGIVHFEAGIRPTQAAHQNATGNNADYVVGRVNTPAALPWTTVHLTDADTGSIFSFRTNGDIVRHSSGFAPWGTGFRIIRGVFAANNPA